MKASESSLRKRVTRIALLLFPATVVLFLLVPAAFAQSITNGSFESVQIAPTLSTNPADMPGWTHTGTVGDALRWRVGYVDGGGSVTTAGAGNQFVTLGGGFSATGSADWSSIITGLTTGTMYDLSFMTATELGTGIPQTMTVSFSSGSSTAPQSFTSPLSSANYWRTWVTQHYFFVPTASSATVHFSVSNQQYDMGLDNVSVAPAVSAAPATTYTNDTNIADFTSGIITYATFSNFSNGDGCATSPFTPTSAELAGPTACRVYTGTLSAGLPAGNNWFLATFPSPVSAIVVFPDIDHFGSPYDGYQYQIQGSNDLASWTPLYDATSVSNTVEHFTLVSHTGTAPTTVNNVLTPGAGPGGTVGYIAQFQFGTAYKYYAFGASTVAFAQSNPDQELSAVGASPTQVQTTPAPTNGTTDTTVSTTFNNTAGQHVENDVIVPPSNNLTFPPGIDPATLRFQSTNRLVPDAASFTRGTPFATFVPFDHAGNDALAGTTGNGAKYEVRCSDATHPPSEDNCPTPNTTTPPTHIRAKDIFDLPKDAMGNFIQPMICTPGVACGTTVSFVHWFPNFITGNTSWSASSLSPNPACTNVTMPGFACDLDDILVNKYCPSNGYGSDTKKGDYFLGYNVPMLLSAVKVNGTSVNTPGIQGSAPFFVRSPLTFDFNVAPAQCPTLPTPCANNWVAAPVSNLFYTFDPLANAPHYPGTTDLTDLTNCPGTNCTVTTGTPAASSTTTADFAPTPAMPFNEGQYLLQWSAADTVKIRERYITINPTGSCPNPFPNVEGPFMPPCYSTKLFSAQITVDNTPPTVTGLTLSPNTQMPGQNITASYTCSDPLSNGVASGLASCGKNLSLGGALGPLALNEMFTVPTGVNGTQSYSVKATDRAGNSFTASANYFAGYQFFGFFAPVSNPASTIPPVINVIKGGQTVPIKWQVLDWNSVGVIGLTVGLSN